MKMFNSADLPINERIYEPRVYDAPPTQPPSDSQTVAEIPISKQWPVMGDEAKWGIVGRIADLATEHSEADPVAVMATVLVYAAAEFGRHGYFRISDGIHHSRHFAALVGQSSRGRKGTSYNPVERIFRRAENIRLYGIDSDYLPDPPPVVLNVSPLQVSNGPLSSGEGLIYVIRDPISDDDPGIIDKRLLVVEEEFGNALRMFQRTGNNLSMIMRGAWDGKTIAPMTKGNRMRASRPHINLLGHVTKHELTSLLAGTEIWNGFANRVLWFMVRRSKKIPFPLPMKDSAVAEIAREMADIISHAHADRELRFSPEAAARWPEIYEELSHDYAGILGQVTARQEAQAWRLAATYAQLDRMDEIKVAHLESALAIVRYTLDSARYLFGDRDSDPMAQNIIDVLKKGPQTQTDIFNLFGGNKPATEINNVLQDLQERGRITLEVEKTGGRGRPKTIWTFVR